MSGLPGSGKSRCADEMQGSKQIVSADDFFVGRDGYVFDKTKLADAHGMCLRRFVVAVMERFDLVVVDNTNTEVVEIAPYAAIALAYGYDLEVVTVACDPEIAFKRNVHGVPRHVFDAMVSNLKERKLLPRWPSRTIVNH